MRRCRCLLIVLFSFPLYLYSTRIAGLQGSSSFKFPHFMKNRFFSHTLYPNDSFSFFYSSWFLTMSLLLFSLYVSLGKYRLLRDNSKKSENKIQQNKRQKVYRSSARQVNRRNGGPGASTRMKDPLVHTIRRLINIPS